MVFTFALIPSTEQLLSGIPRFVEISANQPATFYYTLDGSLPTPMGLVYTGPITMPTDAGSATLSAIAYYLDSFSNLVPSAILSEIFSTDHSAMDDRDRLLFFEGVVYISPGGPDNPFFYDENGDVINPIDVPLDEFKLNLIVSETDAHGVPVEVENAVEIMSVEETPTLFDNNFKEFSSVNGREIFDPSAMYILIDGREGAAPQQVTLINGPFMSLRDMRKDYGGIGFYNTLATNVISGSSVRPHYDRSKGIIVFQYFDSNSGRWIKSIQTLAPAPKVSGPIQRGPGITFKWFVFGRQQG